jgi:hypothetical protein
VRRRGASAAATALSRLHGGTAAASDASRRRAARRVRSGSGRGTGGSKARCSAASSTQQIRSTGQHQRLSAVQTAAAAARQRRWLLPAA